jgi:twitching motility two-component system response regulator PilH
MAMPQSKNIVIIEDDPDLRMTLEYLLGRIGYGVIAVKNGEEGLKHCVERKPQAILCDIALPRMNGYEVCQKLKGDPVTQDIAVIFISAKKPSEIQDEGSKACADFFIAKPVDPNDVGADLYLLFENHFNLGPNELKQLRVTKRIPKLSEARVAGYGPQDENVTHLTAPPHRMGSDVYGRDDHPANARPQAHPQPRTETRPAPAAIGPRPSGAAATASPSGAAAHGSPSSMELKQVHDLLLALRTSLRDTSQRLDAILQYIDVVDKT